MSHISVYLNPHASGAQHTFETEEIKRYFSRQDIRFKSPGTLEELEKMIRQDREEGVECIFSIGGDGTAHTIAQNLVGSKTKMMVLPGGTANDFASQLGTNSDLKKLASIFHAKTTREVDIIKINDKYLMTNGGVGIAYKVTQGINIFRKVPLFKRFLKAVGKAAYSLVFIKQVLAPKFERLEVFMESPDFPLLDKKIKSALILVNNQAKLAGKFPVAPKTVNDDGKFNVTIFMHETRLGFILSTSAFLMGKFPKNDKKIIQFETTSLKMMSLSNQDLNFFGDGENFAPAKELNIGIIPKGLTVCSDDQSQTLVH